jgi:ATP-dependent Clp protease ATP-binding subunit ClpC
MFERYTDSAKRVIFFAGAEANHRDEAAIGPEDLLLGLIREEPALTASVPLRDFAVDLRARMGIPHLPCSSHPYLRRRDISLSDGGKTAVAYAAEEADLDREFWIEWDHLLRGLLRFENAGSEALVASGITIEGVRSAVRKQREQNPAQPAPRPYRLRKLIYRTRYIWIFLLTAILVTLARSCGH